MSTLWSPIEWYKCFFRSLNWNFSIAVFTLSHFYQFDPVKKNLPVNLPVNRRYGKFLRFTSLVVGGISRNLGKAFLRGSVDQITDCDRASNQRSALQCRLGMPRASIKRNCGRVIFLLYFIHMRCSSLQIFQEHCTSPTLPRSTRRIRMNKEPPFTVVLRIHYKDLRFNPNNGKRRAAHGGAEDRATGYR